MGAHLCEQRLAPERLSDPVLGLTSPLDHADCLFHALHRTLVREPHRDLVPALVRNPNVIVAPAGSCWTLSLSMLDKQYHLVFAIGVTILASSNSEPVKYVRSLQDGRYSLVIHLLATVAAL